MKRKMSEHLQNTFSVKKRSDDGKTSKDMPTFCISVGFEDLRVVTIKNTVFWDMT
jgi:hypothetical protein